MTNDVSVAGDEFAAEVRNLWKSFGGVPVLKGVSLSLNYGEIHALVGGNGAGKSTLMKAITGVIPPDDGEVLIGGKVVRALSPKQAHANYVYMVPQEPQLFPNLTVRENLTLALEGVEVKHEEIAQTLAAFAPHIHLDTTASELSISDQQIIEIVRGVLRRARVLVVDEPTAALTVNEAEKLFERLRHLSQEGVGIFYITHRLNEIFELCTTVTVLRDGQIVLSKPVMETSVSEIVQEMVPSARKYEAWKTKTSNQNSSEPALVVEGLSGQGFKNISFSVAPGEILGIAGLVGAGRTEVAETLYGIRPGKGTVILNGKPYNQRAPRESLDRGLAYVPEDRHRNGVFLLGNIIDNVTSTVLPLLSHLGVISKRDEDSFTTKLMDSLSLQKGSLSRRVGSLSGGNQQKVSLAKALAVAPKVVVLDEPSRGVDVGARADLYRLIGDLAQQGTAVVVISSDFDEIVEVSSRVIVIREGEVAAEISANDISFSRVRNTCFGLESTNA